MGKDMRLALRNTFLVASLLIIAFLLIAGNDEPQNNLEGFPIGETSCPTPACDEQ
jgi:hypothetical protein